MRALFNNNKISNKVNSQILKLSEKIIASLYTDALFTVTNLLIKDNNKAKLICEEIGKHKAILEKTIGRSIILEAAVFDYFEQKRDFKIKAQIVGSKQLQIMAKEAITDSKTKTFTGIQLLYSVNNEIQRIKRYGSKFSLLMFDLDDFKGINDTYGHIVGDDVILLFVKLIKSNLRSIDSLYRFGGDEFAALLPETGETGAIQFAKKINHILNSTICPQISKSISASIGIAVYGQNGFNTYKSIIQAADKALYKAKAAGKDCVAINVGQSIKVLKKKNEKIANGIIEKKFKCKELVNGFAKGTSFIYEGHMYSDISNYEISKENALLEYDRIISNINSLSTDLIKMAEIVKGQLDKEHSAIYTAQDLILKDQTLLMSLKNELNLRLLNGEIIVRDVFKEIEDALLLSESDSIQQKSKDIRDLGIRLVKKMQGRETHSLSNLPPDTIIVAKQLLPSDTFFLDKKNIKGLVLSEGSKNSHCTILAKALGIPSVTMKNAHFKIPNKTELIINTFDESIFLHPNQNTLKRFTSQFNEWKKQQFHQPRTKLQSMLYKKQKITTWANVSNYDEALLALHNSAAGIGLFRIENIYMASAALPDESYLYDQFKTILQPMKGKDIILRLSDLGADKSPAYLNLKATENPVLGLRGIRLLFKHRKLLDTQLRAINKLYNEIPVKILIPMVSTDTEIKRIKKIMKNNIGNDTIQIGAMIELPAAVFNIDKILKSADFISIGSNDLLQYTMGADRENADLNPYQKSGYSILLNVIKEIAEKAKKKGVDCSLCGEWASEILYTERLLKSGLTRFSVTPSMLPQLNSTMQKIISMQKK